MKTLLTALIALLPFLSPALNAQDQQSQQQSDPTIDPCASLLPKDPDGYKKCKDGQLEGLAIACTIYSYSPSKRLIESTIKYVVGQACPDSKYAEALKAKAAHEYQERKKAAEAKCIGGNVTAALTCQCPVNHRWANNRCEPRPCSQGYEWNPTEKVCRKKCADDQYLSMGNCVDGPPPNNPNPPTCGTSEVWDPKVTQCVCQPGTKRNTRNVCTSQPTTVCTGGKTKVGSACVCTGGKTENSQGICVSPPTQTCTTDSEGNRTCSTPSTPDASDQHPTPLTNEEVYEQEQKIEQEINNQLNQQNCSVAGQIRDSQGVCVWPPCPSGQTRNAQGVCTKPPCPRGQVRNAYGVCAAPPPPPCGAGQSRDAFGNCYFPAPTCYFDLTSGKYVGC